MRVSILHASAIPDLARFPKYHPDLSSFKCMASISPNLGVFYLHEQALLAMGLESACGIAITLDIVVHCNIAIRPESVATC